MPNKVKKKTKKFDGVLVTEPEPQMPVEDFLGKIDCEGGILEAFFGYGLTTDGYDIPDRDKKHIDNLLKKVRPMLNELGFVISRLEDSIYNEEEE